MIHVNQYTVINVSLIDNVGCLTWWCPCIAFGQVAEILDKGTTCKYVYSNVPIIMIVNRKMLDKLEIHCCV